MARPSLTPQHIKIGIATIVALVVLFLPPRFLGLPMLTIVEQRMLALAIFTVIMWVTEAIPIWCTSVLSIGLMLILLSTGSFTFMSISPTERDLGTLVSYRDIMASFADPMVMLALGGFILSIGATNTGLDSRMVHYLIRPFGSKSEMVLLGFMIISATLSMFVNNTATAAIMLAMLTPVLQQLSAEGQGHTSRTLGVLFAANIGGRGTPVGTPTNTLTLKLLNSPSGLNLDIDFGTWMFFMVPLVIILITCTWAILLYIFPFKKRHISVQLPTTDHDRKKTRIVTITTFITILLWITESITGLSPFIIGFLPFCVFCATGIIGVKDLRDVHWDVLWLLAGSFAITTGMEKTGLAPHIIEGIPFADFNPVVTILLAGLICYGLSTFISNTATSSLMLPILASLAVFSESISEFDGGSTLLLGIALSTSLAMGLPFSTPPNAMAHATGFVTQQQMAKVGFAVGAIGYAIGYLLLFYVSAVDLF